MLMSLKQRKIKFNPRKKRDPKICTLQEQQNICQLWLNIRNRFKYFVLGWSWLLQCTVVCACRDWWSLIVTCCGFNFNLIFFKFNFRSDSTQTKTGGNRNCSGFRCHRNWHCNQQSICTGGKLGSTLQWSAGNAQGLRRSSFKDNYCYRYSTFMFIVIWPRGRGYFLVLGYLPGMCCWMGLHFHDSTDYNGVTFSSIFKRNIWMGSHFLGL